MRNPCTPSTPRQNELQRREKHTQLYDQEKEISSTIRLAQEIAWLVTQPTSHYSLPLPGLCRVCLYLVGGTWLQGATTTPHLPPFPLKTTHKPHYYQLHLNHIPTFSPLVLLVLCQFSRVFVGLSNPFDYDLVSFPFHLATSLCSLHSSIYTSLSPISTSLLLLSTTFSFSYI